jgi:hypothetical protein
MPPKPSGDFTAFMHRSNFDLVMFGYVQGMRRALPGLTLERIMDQFLAEYRLTDLKAKSQLRRYHRMAIEYYGNQKTATA